MAELRVKELLKQKGMTMAEMAGKMGVPPESLYRSINGSNPSFNTLNKMAEALSVELPDLFNRIEPQVYGVVVVDGEAKVIGNVKELKEVADSL